MISIGISEFRANMSGILQKVQKGEIVSLMVRGTEIAKLVPPDYARLTARKELAELRQTAILGDVLAPIDEDWEVME